jgi:hypothetical protein
MAVEFMYKCRRCGDAKMAGSAPDALTFMLHVVHDHPLPETWGGGKYKMVDIHCCADGGYGAADFIGVGPKS